MKLRRIIQIPIIVQLLMGFTCVEFQPKSKIFKFLSGIARTSKDVLNGTVHRVWDYLSPADILYPDETVVCDLFEYFKVKMRSSYPHLDLPVLDPFTTDYLEGNIVHDVIGNVSIHLQAVNLTGLSQYEIKKVKMNWLPRRLNLNVNFPHILARCVYSIGGILGDVIPLHGNGPAQLSLMNLNIKGEIFLGTLNGYIYIKSMSLNYTVQEIKVDLTNIMGGGRLGELLNKALSEEGPRILDLVREDLTYFCENWLNKHANNVLAKISITLNGVIDFLKIIGIPTPLSVIFVGTAAVVCYVNSLDGGFVFDDSEAIVNNEDLKPETPISNLLYNDFWGTRLTHNASHKSYRPLTVLSFRWNYWLAGGLHPKGFHLTNIALHAAVSMLSLAVYNLLLCGMCHRATLLTALLFAVHPIHAEAVAGVVGRADLLCALFYFLSFITYCSSLRLSWGINQLATLLLSMVLCAMAMFCKEQGITVIGLCSVYDIIVNSKLHPIVILRAVWRHFNFHGKEKLQHDDSRKEKLQHDDSRKEKLQHDDSRKEKLQHDDSRKEKLQHDDSISSTSNCDITFAQNNNLKDQNQHKYLGMSEDLELRPLLLRHMVLLLSGLFLLFIRWRVMASAAPTFQRVDNPASFSDSMLTRMFSYNYVYALNGWLLLCPEWLCFDWSMGCIPLLEKIEPRLIVVGLFWTILGLLMWKSLTLPNGREQRSLTMSLAATIIPFLPASNLFFRVGFVIAERVLYLPSVGFCLIVIVGLGQLSSFQRIRQAVQMGFVYVMFIFMMRALWRSAEWRTEAVLFRSGLSVCPLNAKVHYNIAKNAGDAGNKTLAVYEYREALRLYSDYDQAMNNLANILKDEGKLKEAEDLLRKAVQLRPDFAAAWMNLGIVLSGFKRHGEAEASYFTALVHRKKYPDCYYNLGNLYLDQQRYDDAYRAWRNATALKPTHTVAWSNMIIMLDSVGQMEKAEIVAQEALSILPMEPSLHFNLANTLGKAGRFAEAEKHFTEAIGLDMKNSVYYTNLGVLYHRWKKYDKAERLYRRALEINPHLQSAKDNMALLQRAKSRLAGRQ